MSSNFSLVEDIAELISNILFIAQNFRYKRRSDPGGYISKALPLALKYLDDLEREFQWQAPPFAIATEEAKQSRVENASPGLQGIWVRGEDEVPCLHYPEKYLIMLYLPDQNEHIPLTGFCHWNNDAGVYEFLLRNPPITAFVGNSNQSRTKLFIYCLDEGAESVLYTFTRSM